MKLLNSKWTAGDNFRGVSDRCMAVQRVRTKMQQLLFVSVSILVFAGDCGSSLDVSSSHFGTFDFAELEQVQYDLEISGSPIPERDGDSNSNSREV